MNKYLEEIQALLVHQFACLTAHAHSEARLEEDLHLDELDQIEILVSLEENYYLEIRGEDAERWKTVLDIANYIEKRMGNMTEVDLASRKDGPTHPWVIRINDGFCEYEYKLGSRNGSASVDKVYQAVREFLDAEEQNGTLIKHGNLYH